MHILLVEDDASVREVARRALHRFGASVVSAPDAEQAAERIREAASPFDVVIADVVLPGMTGYDLAALVRGRSPETAVLLVSGYMPHALVERERTRGLAVLEKPFSPDELCAAIRKLTGEAPAF
jgi:two-component system, cell cycle sensor histidine kinase and response regulator CckA